MDLLDKKISGYVYLDGDLYREIFYTNLKFLHEYNCLNKEINPELLTNKLFLLVNKLNDVGSL